MTSSTPLPPPTEEQMEALRAMIQMMRVVAAPTDVMQRMNETGAWPYLAVLAEGLRVMKIRVEDGEGRAMDWCFATEMQRVREGAAFDAMWQPVEGKVSDD
jgi:hypothetical protein